MMPIYLEQRFHLLLNLAKEADTIAFARENLAAANEMIDTMFAVGSITEVAAKAYRAQCVTAQIVASTSDLERTFDLPKTYTSFSDGVRAAQVAK